MMEELSIIKIVDDLIAEAIKNNYSDLHIEPLEKKYRIRARQSGELKEIANFPVEIAKSMLSRIKIMANLNIAEQRLPQDGQIFLEHNQAFSIRVSTCPTFLGEKIVLRLLGKKLIQYSFESLGFLASQQLSFIEALLKPQGLILVTGPTGSGKTSTLYSAISFLNKTNQNICSVEDPVEVNFEGINQINVDQKIHLNFSTLLRSLLRQDPDVIMIGEIRDAETAQIAVEASLTGHLVLATLHTNDVKGSLLRLLNLKVPWAQIVNSISFIVNQRLFKLAMDAKPQTRLGIFECLNFNETIKSFLRYPKKIFYLNDFLKKNNHSTLKELAFKLLQKKLMTPKEIERLLGSIE